MAQATQTGNADQPDWDAARYEEALAHLERLQELIDGMKSDIPSIVAPIQRQTRDKAQLFVETKTAAVQAVTDVQQLRTTWNSEQTQDIFAKTKDSFAKDGDLSKARNVPRWGWAEQD
ncbi:hypothetical protein HII31_06397 [Pseudocercospora fuligena]|uniref:Uncharacterized protein n=1 Tax=Pseudocercospora fuligena TaxID=685502 RepID=A0A8H6VMP7_9PEZI|nr:hypothetical protein HII31_06397 [Pseudocercospora fuligena]